MRVGRYHVTRKLATGGMGEVLLAVRRAAGGIERQVVIKRIRRDRSGDVRFVEMFLREAQLSATLSHKNIVPVFDFGKVGQDLFIAMEYIRGRDLGRALRAAREAETPLPAPVVAHLGIEVCRALDHAHQLPSPVIHRDLSPKNLLISFAGDVLVADFGLAVTAAEVGAGVRGTPAYMSPEQARGEPVDRRSDLFSLGLVLREAFEGERAYGGDDPAAVIERARAATLPPLGPSIPAPLAGIIETATRADPAERFASAREMLGALDRYLVTARAAGAPPPAHALADWLGALFAPDEPLGTPAAADGGEVRAVTYVDQGLDAVARSVLGRSMLSAAETVGDSELQAREGTGAGAADATDAAGAAEMSGEPAREPETSTVSEAPRSRRWWIAAIAIAAIAVSGAVVWTARRDRDHQRVAATTTSAPPPVADAAPQPVIDAALPPVIDAAPPPVIDAAPRRRADAAPPRGTLVIQTDSWARVEVLGTRRGCAETPCSIRLAAGHYRVALTNPTSGARVVRPVDVPAGGERRLIVKMPPR